MSNAIRIPQAPKAVTAPAKAAAGDAGWAQTFVERAKAEIAAAPPVEAMTYVREAGSVVGEYTEGGLTGAMLGTAHARFGLDTDAGPVDGWVAVLGAIIGVAASGTAPFIAARARSIGAKSFTVLAFRKAYELVKHEPLIGRIAGGVQRIGVPGKGSGVTREDPIEIAARGLE